MSERVFEMKDLTWPEGAVCPSESPCLSCGLVKVFVNHLTEIRVNSSSLPPCSCEIELAGHDFSLPKDGEIIPHFALVRKSPCNIDVVLWERMSRNTFTAWAPAGSSKERLELLRTSVDRLIELRRKYRSGAATVPYSIRRSLADGRYLSARFILEYWNDLGIEWGVIQQ